MARHIYPKYTIIFTYDVRPEMHEQYYRFVTSKFLPELQNRKLYMQNVWLMMYGDAPERQVEFISEDLDTVRDLLNDEQWQKLEDRLKGYTQNYTRRIMKYSRDVKVISDNGRN